jgi:hypothetical protein
MALTGDQIKKLNSFFAEDRIKNTATKLVPKLTANAPLGRLTEELGIVPKDQVKQFRENCKAVPPIISSALTRAIRVHLSAINKKEAFDGPRAIHISIRGGHDFGLQIAQQKTHTEITLTMRTTGNTE